MRDLELPRGEAIPKRFLRARFVRAGGPGGQNVNKVATKVDLRLDLEGALEILGQSRVDRIRAKLDGRLDADGSLHVTSSEHRSQLQNLEAAITRMETLIRGALVRPKKRRPTKPTRASKKRRVEGKRQRGDLKKGRAGKDWS